MAILPDDITYEEALAYLLGLPDYEALQTAGGGWLQLAGFLSAVIRAQMIRDVRAMAIDAAAEGKSLGEFKKEFRVLMEKGGWIPPKLDAPKPKRKSLAGIPYKQRIAIQTPIRNAYQLGRYQQVYQGGTGRRKGYLIYLHGGSREPRPHHLAWDGTVLRYDHPAWLIYWPLNGFGCSCKVFPISRGQLRRRGLRVLEDWPDNNLPDEGFRTSPGLSGVQASIRRQLLADLPDDLRALVEADTAAVLERNAQT